METKRLIGPWDLFKASWDFYIKNLTKILGLVLAPLIIGAVSYIFVSNNVIFAVISFVAAVVAMIARIALLIAISSGDALPSVSESYKKGWALFWQFVWVSVLSALAAMGGFLILIVPGIIIGVLLSFSNYTLVIEGRKGMSALTLSWAYVKGYWWPVFGRFLIPALLIFAINLLINAVVPGTSEGNQQSIPDQIANFIFSMIFVLPFMTIYGFQMYKNIKEVKARMSFEAEEQVIAKRLKIFSILGIVAIFVAIILAYVIAVFLVSKLNGMGISSGDSIPFLNLIQR